MRAPDEFHYRLAKRVRGHRPGSHPGLNTGAGQEFVSHMRLFDRPDPRRLDLRASLRSTDGDWLVRVHRQRTGVSVHAVVDVSASMSFGAGKSKLQVVGQFLESLGVSAFRAGDAAGLLAFDTQERTDLFVPARLSRGGGTLMAQAVLTVPMRVRAERAPARSVSRGDNSRDGGKGLEQVASRLVGRAGLVFIVSDFHWPLDRLRSVLDLLSHAQVVPIVVWDTAESEPPAANGFVLVRDRESGARRTLWMRSALRTQWRESVARRRAELDEIFRSAAVSPFYVNGEFSAEALSRYFFEGSL